MTEIGKAVRFRPAPGRRPNLWMNGTVVRHRPDPPRGGTDRRYGVGWLDVVGEDGIERSVRPSQIEAAK